MNYLSGDIGGTNTRLIYFSESSLGRKIIAETFYKSKKYSTFEMALKQFISENSINSIDAACLAVAGPVTSGIVSVTNLPWVVSEEKLKGEFKIPYVKVINDFVAIAYGLSELKNSDFLTLQSFDHDISDDLNNDAVVVGAGTGLGVSHLICKNGVYHPQSSEAGHASFSAHNQQQCNLLSWLMKKDNHVSQESILSGRGLLTIYRYLRDVEGLAESSEISDKFVGSDPAQVIAESALADTDTLCVKTVNMFISIYGGTASDIVLHYYPVSTLYIAGGIAAKISKLMTAGTFLHAFLSKGLMADNMKKIEIKLVCEERAGLLGAMAQSALLTK